MCSKSTDTITQITQETTPGTPNPPHAAPEGASRDTKARFWDRIPLASRITAWFTIFLALMLVLLGLFILQFSHQWEDTEIRNQLQSHTTAGTGATKDDIVLGYKDGIYAILCNKKGVALRGTLPEQFPTSQTLSPHKVTQFTTTDGRTFYYYDYPLTSGARTYWVRNIMPLTPLERKIDILILTLLLGGLLFLLSGTIGGYLLIKRGLRPLRDITRTSLEIGQKNDLSRRLPPYNTCNDEITDLASTLNAMLNNLEQADQRVKQFNSDVSHELRTPIAVMQAESDYGRAYTQSVEEAKKGFQIIFEQCQFMTDIVSQLLAMARIDAIQTIDQEPIDLTQLMHSIVHGYQTLHKDKPISLRAHVQANLTINGNAVLLKQAICNLLDNAYKFTKDAISIRAYVSRDKVFIIIEDNGIGISEENLPKIWDRLYQIEQSRKKKGNGGVGIGLYFVKNVINLHKAEIFVSSIPNQMTRFTLVFPYVYSDLTRPDGHESKSS